MKKKEILKTVEYKGDDKNIQQSVTRIKDLLTAIPENADLGAISGLDDFGKNGAFGTYNYQSSQIDNKEEKNRILNNLDSIFHEITKWIKDHPIEAKYYIRTQNREKDNKRRKIMIVFLTIIAVAAIVITVLEYFTDLISTVVPVGEIIGLVDLVIGISGLIYELADDGKKESVCKAVDDIGNSKTTNELLKTADKYIKINNKNMALSLFHIGSTSQINEQVINNYFNDEK